MPTGHTPRQRPRWSEIRPLLGLEAPPLSRSAQLQRAATADDLRRLARRRVPRAVFDYVDGAAEEEVSLARARAAFERVEFRPRVLHDVSAPDLSTMVLGRPAAMPLILAPTGFTRMMHHDGERAVSAAAAAAGVPYALSTLGTVTPEELAATRGDADHWFQLYVWTDRDASRALLDRVAGSGYRVLVLTVDAPVAGARLRDVHNGLSVPPKLTLRTLTDMSRHVSWWVNVLTTPPLTFASLSSSDGTVAQLMDRVFDPHITLADIEWLRQVWEGPLVVKGIQCPADARRVVDAGADGVVVSNHGGRQLDRAATPLEELPAVTAEVGGQAEVYVDGGVRTGADVIAAVGLGAKAVMIGRAYLYGLMAGGQAGVGRVLDIFRADMMRTLALLGVPAVGALDAEAVRLRP